MGAKGSMEQMEGIESVLAGLRDKYLPLPQTAKHSNGDRICQRSYDWLSPEERQRYMADIVRIEDKQDLCKDCDGICRQDTEGFFPVVSKTTTGRFSSAMQMCRREEVKREQARLERIIQSSGIPRTYMDKTFADYIVTEGNRKAVNVAKWLVGHKDMGAMFYGATGTGKTLLAAIVAREKMRQGIAVAFASVPDLLMDIRGSFDTGGTAEILRSVQQAPCLVLDDLGAERMSGWVSEQVFAIINYRSNYKLQTIITSNYRLDKLAGHMMQSGKEPSSSDLQSRRIVSRICGMCYVVKICEKDFRMQP